jgi:uncharacterized protein
MVLRESPFIFGRKAVGDKFTDREAETKRLVSNFQNKVNTVLISPRRWGKSSLVKKACDLVASEKTIVIQMDAFGIRDPKDFYTLLTTEVIKNTSGKVETWLENIRKFISRLSPKISFGADPFSTFELAFDMEAIDKNYSELLDLPEKIAIEKKINLIICIDEFQNTANFSESDLFHKRLRTAWQNHQSVTYCLYGSKKHMMSTLFEKQSMPFYKFGETINLGKISAEHWVAFIIERFQSTGKKISEDQARIIIQSVKAHSYYVQQLSHLTWLRTSDSVENEIITLAIEDLLAQNANLYQLETEMLSETQLNLLKAIASGINDGFSNTEILTKFRLGTSANISKQKKVLQEKELVDIRGTMLEFLDPAYELWFKKNILRIPLPSPTL